MKSIKQIRISRKFSHRKFVIRSLFGNLCIHKDIITTKNRAKLLKSFGNSLLNKLINYKSLNFLRIFFFCVKNKQIARKILLVLKKKEKGENFISCKKIFYRLNDGALMYQVKISL